MAEKETVYFPQTYDLKASLFLICLNTSQSQKLPFHPEAQVDQVIHLFPEKEIASSDIIEQKRIIIVLQSPKLTKSCRVKDRISKTEGIAFL